MDLGKLPVFAALKRQMDWLNERQRVLAQNIANVDTPGYRPHDLKTPNFGDLLAAQNAQGTQGAGGKLMPTVTSPMHLSLVQQATFKEEVAHRVDEAAPAGNAVKLEDELVKLADTQLQYATAASLVKKQVGMILTALGKR
jgi:flagellar basal-body rod protein FlgB